MTTLAQLRADIPAGGIRSNVIFNKYKSVASHPETKGPFMALLKHHYKMVPNGGEKFLIPKLKKEEM